MAEVLSLDEIQSRLQEIYDGLRLQTIKGPEAVGRVAGVLKGLPRDIPPLNTTEGGIHAPVIYVTCNGFVRLLSVSREDARLEGLLWKTLDKVFAKHGPFMDDLTQGDEGLLPKHGFLFLDCLELLHTRCGPAAEAAK